MLNKIIAKIREVVMAFVNTDAANGTVKNQANDTIEDQSQSMSIPLPSMEVKSNLDVDHEHDGNRLSRAIYLDDVNAFKTLVTNRPCMAQHFDFYRVGKSGIDTLSTLNYIVECAAKHMIEKNKEMLSFALECGADINARSPNKGWTPLETAIYSEKYFLIPFLIQNGARPNHGPRADALIDDVKMLWAFFRQSAGGFTCNDSELVEIVDAFASIGLVKSGFEMACCETLDTQEMTGIAQNCRKSFLDLIAQVDAAKAKKEKDILLRELAVASEDVEVRPRRRM